MPGGLREVVLSFKFRQNRLNGFRDVGGRKLSFPILKASGLYNSLYYRTSRDNAHDTYAQQLCNFVKFQLRFRGMLCYTSHFFTVLIAIIIILYYAKWQNNT